MTTEQAHSFKVLVGNCEELKCTKVCPRVLLILGQHEFLINLLGFPLNGVELVLGFEWLKTTGGHCDRLG